MTRSIGTLRKETVVCITSAPAILSDTHILVSMVREDFHLMGYQNTVKNLVRPAEKVVAEKAFDLWNQKPEVARAGNAMILPIPAMRIERENLFDSGLDPDILQRMARTILVSDQEATRTYDGPIAKSIEIIDVGVYTVVVAQSVGVDQIAEALQSIPIKKQPVISLSLMESFIKFYPDWPILICCFSVSEATKAGPIFVAYTPIRGDFLFFPALDAHDGNSPNLADNVKVDHVLLASAMEMDVGRDIRFLYNQKMSANSNLQRLPQLMPNRVIGREQKGTRPNGDWAIRIEDVYAGNTDFFRILPPGAVMH